VTYYCSRKCQVSFWFVSNRNHRSFPEGN
jgi:hypothetical protein